jgi:Arrestin (or S-antigen), N-terminal domain
MSVFQAGHPLTGKVVLKVRRPLRHGGTLGLRIDGKEKVDLSISKRASKRAERNFLQVHLELNESQSVILPKTYSFPFRIDLPASLPSSTKYPANTTSSKGFRIQYKMKVGIEGIVETDCVIV